MYSTRSSPATSLVYATILVLIVAGGVALVYRFTNSEILLGILGGTVAIITAAFQYRAAKDNETAARLFQEKQAIYKELISIIMDQIKQKGRAKTTKEEAQLIDKMQDIRKNLIIWGSADTIRCLDRLSDRELKPEEIDAKDMITWFSELFSSVRKDLGHKDPPNAALEMALGILTAKDRAEIRAKFAGK